MRRFTSLLSVIVLLIVSMGVSISAQEATPPAETMEMPDSFEIAPGVVADHMLFAEGAEGPSVYRLTFEAGVVYPVTPSPSLDLGYLESGSLVMTFDASVTVKQLSDPQGEGQNYSAGTEFTLNPGDYLVLPSGAAGEIRNDSSEPAVFSIAGLIPGGTDMGSPEASPQG